jgi:hypothetical membrane protein
LKDILAPFATILVFILIARIFAPPEYRWKDNSISEMAAQGLPNRWIMQAGFISFGLLLAVVLGWRMWTEKRVALPDLAITLYGLSILAAGLFSAEPFLEGVPFSAQEARLHTVFAYLAGFFLTVGILLALVAAPGAGEKRLHTIFLLLVVGLSALYGLVDAGSITLPKGLLQRVLWLAGFGWLYWWF